MTGVGVRVGSGSKEMSIGLALGELGKGPDVARCGQRWLEYARPTVLDEVAGYLLVVGDA